MSRKTALVKVSGDVFASPEFIEKIGRMTEGFFVVICVGGGKQINEALEARGLPRKDHGPLGRELETLELRQLARDVLERNKAKLEDLLAAEYIHATVEIPVLDIAGVMCHVNGDEFIKLGYNGFDELFVVTTFDRVKAKQAQFAPYPKIKILALRDPAP